MILRTNLSLCVIGSWLVLLCGTAAAAQQSAPDMFEQARQIGRQRSVFKSAAGTPQRTETPKANVGEFAKSIKPILEKTCVQCHGADAQEGNVRIDTLNPDLLHGDDIDWWLEVQAVLSKGEMPPPDEVELADSDRAMIIDWLSNEIQTASIVRRATAEHSSFRRMTRYEFNYALQDVLGLPYDFAKDLPPEANSEDGFQNSSELLHMTVSQLETYRRLARKALMRATVRGARPPVLHWGVTMQDAGRVDWAKQAEQFQKIRSETANDPDAQKNRIAKLEKSLSKPHPVPYFRDLTNGRTVRASWGYGRAQHALTPTDQRRAMPDSFSHAAILPRGHQRFTIELGNRVPDEGRLRVRVRASRAEPKEGEVPTLQLLFGWQASNEGRAVLPVPNSERPVLADPDKPTFYQWDVPLGEIYPRNSVRKTSPMGSMPNPSEYIRLVNSSVSQGPIRIDYVEIAAPVYDEWPPASHKQIFFESENQADKAKYSREVLLAFMKRAWRRPISEEELSRKLLLFVRMRPQCETFEEAMVEVLATVLASPQFLYVSHPADGQLAAAGNAGATENGGKSLTSHELATRLSMFLWSSVPDSRLSELADSGQLLEADVLADQVERMLADDRCQRLSKHFVHQWLDMQLLEFLSVKRGLATLKTAMQEEPVRLFEEMLRTNASVLDFVHSDYTMANERLAMHYGLRNVKGNHFRRVELSSRNRRGGLLTQAGLLAMNSAGDDSHPLKRGVWLLESLLNDPPPPPPPAVPEIDLADPKIAKMTLKEQIEDHRNHAACMSCHSKIDPWGIAFENYDALGRWRNEVKGKPVDASSLLFNKQKLDGMNGLKRFLLENRQDQFVRAMVHKLTTYALGRPLTFADRSSVDEITAKVRQQGDGLATMIKQIGMSDLFRAR